MMCDSCDRNYLSMSDGLHEGIEEYRLDAANGNIPETVTAQAQSLASLFHEMLENPSARVMMAWWLAILFQRAAVKP